MEEGEALPEINNLDAAQETDHPDRSNRKNDETTGVDAIYADAPEAPPFLVRSFGSGMEGSPTKPWRRFTVSTLSTLIAGTIRQWLTVLRRHLERDEFKPRTKRQTGNSGGVLIALFSVFFGHRRRRRRHSRRADQIPEIGSRFA
jgi:hypothetical protein